MRVTPGGVPAGKRAIWLPLAGAHMRWKRSERRPSLASLNWTGPSNRVEKGQ